MSLKTNIKKITSITLTLIAITSLTVSTVLLYNNREVDAFVNSTEYNLRYKNNIPGGIVFTGNANGLSINESDNTLYGGSNALDSVGVFSSLNTSLQVPGYPFGTTKDWNTNGSWANLNLPVDSQIEYAMLEWTGTYFWGPNTNTAIDSIDPATVLTPINFTTSKRSYQVTSDPLYQYYVESGTNDIRKEFSLTSDVTELVKSSGAGGYSVQGIPGILSTQPINGNMPDNTSGWTLAVVYRNNSQTIKNITLYSGSQFSNAPSVNVPGFSTPTEGQVKGKLYVSAFEGDAGIRGDQLKFGSQQDNLTALSGPNNNVDNFFASQINNGDGIIDISGSFGTRNTRSNSDDTLTRHSLDITAVDVSSLLRNNQSTAYIQGTSSGDNYAINVLGLELEVNAPLIKTQITVDKLLTNVGEEITYTVTVKNDGSTSSQNTTSFVQVPPGTSFVLGSLTSVNNFSGDNPTTGLNFGTLQPTESLTYTYKVRVDSVPSDSQYTNQVRTDFDYQMTPQSPLIKESNYSNKVVTQITPAPAQIPNQTPEPIIVVAKDDTINTLPNTPITINIITNDSLPANSNPIVTIIRAPLNGTTRVEGSRIIYVPNKNYTGQDSFVYDVCDQNKCDKATVVVNITRPGQVLGAKDIASPTTPSTTQPLLRSGGLPAGLLVGTLAILSIIGLIVTALTLIEPEDERNTDGEY